MRKRVMEPGQVRLWMIGLAWCLVAATAWAQAAGPSLQCPQTTSGLYTRIRSVGLDPQRVYHVRDATIDRPSLHLDLDDGTLAFTEDICGRITGAFFEGEGEIRLRPPSRVERGSLALFTGGAILEEQFSSGYLRFNDDTAAVLQRYSTPVPESAEFIKEWDDTSRMLAEFDALRLLLDFSHFLPEEGGRMRPPLREPDRKFPPLLHAHLLGKKLGAFEVFWDAAGAEPLWAGQPRMKDGIPFFDIWTSFAPAGAGRAAASPAVSDASIAGFRIRASVQPPTMLRASTEVNVRIRSGGERTLLFELSRYLKIDAAEADGRPVDFIQNPAIEGSQRQRKGNDLVAVVFPAPLVATGKQMSPAGADQAETNEQAAGEKVSRWSSERPIPVAGFNLGKYVRAEARAGNILVEAYATKGVEKSFPKAPGEMIEQPAFSGAPSLKSRSMAPIMVIPPPPSPARDAQAVADKAAKAIGSFSQWFGPYPYGSLALTQMPGKLSQGWPGLVFLSSFAFLSPQEQTDLRLDPVTRALDSQVLVHETAHQWWGDLVLWKSYRDQWIAEGLANYAALLMLEQQNPAQFRQVLEKYRRDLLSKNKDGERLRDAGPVTLGQRLESSHFPGGYEAISYERGTWLFHMLRMMLRDSEAASRSRKGRANPGANSEEPFFRALRKIRERYAGKTVSTHELMQVFEEELPRPLWYEKRPKLDWFLEGWIEGTAIPELESREIRITEKAGVTTVTGVIVQKDVPDDLVTAVPVYATTAGNGLVFLGEVLADGAETGFRLIAPSGVRKMVLDPKQTIHTAPK